MRGGKPQEPQIPIDYWQNFPDQSLGSSHIKQIFSRKVDCRDSKYISPKGENILAFKAADVKIGGLYILSLSI